MRFLVYIPPTEYGDETLSMIELFLNKWGISYDIASNAVRECTGSHGGRCKATVSIGFASDADYSGIIVADGKGIDLYKPFEYRPFLDFVIKLNNSKKFVCGINNGTKILARANIIREKRISVGTKEMSDIISLFRGIPSTKGAEIADNIITVNGSAGLEGPMVQMFNRIETA
jgi:putative intracellular protease/amidase